MLCDYFMYISKNCLIGSTVLVSRLHFKGLSRILDVETFLLGLVSVYNWMDWEFLIQTSQDSANIVTIQKTKNNVRFGTLMVTLRVISCPLICNSSFII